VSGGDRIRPGCAHLFGAPDAVDPGAAHQPGDLVTADVQAGAAGGTPELAGSVDAVVVLAQRDQLRDQCGVAARSGRGRPGLGRVVGARGHLQDPADGLDPEPASFDHVVAVGGGQFAEDD